MEQGRPRSSLSLTSSASTVSSLSSLSAKKPTRVVHKVHAFGKRNNALRRDPNLPVHIRGWLHKQTAEKKVSWAVYCYPATVSGPTGQEPHEADDSPSRQSTRA